MKMKEIEINEKNQAVAPATIKLTAADFTAREDTAIYWLGNAGIMINSHGTTIMIDPF